MSIGPEPPLESGVAGASARREHERRKAARERRIREKHPRIGGAILALSGEPTHQQVWAHGALGEEQVAEWLSKHLAKDVVVLHDRRSRGGRANIDHLAVAPSGVWVIDSKRYRGRVAVATPLFGQAKLTIAGRDKSTLMDALAKQVDLVEAAMGEIASDVPIRGALCFVDADLPMFGTLTCKGFPLLQPRGLTKRINARGPVPSERLGTLGAELAKRFPRA